MNSEGLFEITFPTSKAFNPGASELEQTLTDNFFIQSSCTSQQEFLKSMITVN